ncbi:MAG TPA: hypothetical protein VF214_03905 [Edaphobacter sp.]
MPLYRLFALLPLIVIAGCHSPNVDATISNRTADPVKLIEVDYPSASFGTQSLAPGQDFHYRFKVIGEGAMKLTWTDAANREHKSDGPTLKEGSQGPLTIAINPDGAHWDLHLR